jgi:5-methyltetrahydrofolate--homocysteine methyltransferase
MQTILRSQSKTVTIDIAKPFVVIGEQINPTGRKKLAAALQERNFDYVKQLAVEQVEAGADVLDVNVGVPGMDDVALLPEVIQVVASVVDVPICIDTPNPKALAAALPATPGRPLVNSVNGEENMLNAVLPLVKEHNAAVIGLTMDDTGIPNDPHKRLAIAEKIIERAAQIGIPIEDVVIDPLVMTVGADSKAGVITLETIRLVREKFGVNINLGASNVSFGLPDRQTINQAFLALAMQMGATCAITHPAKLCPTIRATDLLLGRDDYGSRYISYWRKHQPKEEG